MGLGISSGLFSSTLGTSAGSLSGVSSGTDVSSFGAFLEAQQHLDNPTGTSLGLSSGPLDSQETSLNRLSNDAFNAVKLQIQMKLEALLEKQKKDKGEPSSPGALSKTEQLVQFATYLGTVLNDQTRASDHEKASDLLDKVFLKLQDRAAAGDLDAESFRNRSSNRILDTEKPDLNQAVVCCQFQGKRVSYSSTEVQ
jgi:hypothetical protein